MNASFRPPALLCICLLVSTLPLAAVAANLGSLDCDIRDYDGQPIAHAVVELLATDGRPLQHRASDEQGHLDFSQIPFGNYRVKASLKDGRSEQQEVRITSGDVMAIELYIPLPGQEVEIEVERPKAPPPGTSAASISTLDRQNIQDLPRGDSSSVNEILATQSGFVNDALGNLYSRGNHANIQYQVDGVPLPDSVSGLFGGFLSPKLVENLEILTGGLGAEYGERLAGVVNLNTRKPSKDGQGEFELMGGSYQTLKPSGSYGRQFGALSVLAGGSYQFTQRALDPQTFDGTTHDSGDEERAYLRLDYDLGERTHISALGAFAHNFYRLPIDTSLTQYDPALPNGGRMPDSYGNPPPSFIPFDTNQSENEQDIFALLSIRHDFADSRASLRIAASYRHSEGYLESDPAHALGPTADPCSPDAGCATASNVGRTADHLGVNVEQRLRVGDHQLLQLGGQFDQLFGSTNYIAYTRSDILQAPDPGLTIRGSDNARVTSGGAYIQDRIALGRWVINAGIRFDAQAVRFRDSGSRNAAAGVGPRLGAAYSLTKDTVAHAYIGLLWQPPAALDAPSAARILGVLQPGQVAPYDLLPERDQYAELGIESRILPELSLKLTAWGRLSTDQLDDVSVGNTNLVSPYNFRDGRAGGIEAGVVTVLGSHLNAFANASLERAQGRGIESARYLFSAKDLANTNWQLLDHTQTWTANVGATVKDGFTQLSSTLAYGSGLRTGANNDQNVPGHIKVDISLQHQFFNAPAKPTIGLDIVNLFDAHYAYRVANGFIGSSYAPGRSAYLRASAIF